MTAGMLKPLGPRTQARVAAHTPAKVSEQHAVAAQTIAAAAKSPVTERDLDLFLRSRAQVRGASALPGSLQALLANGKDVGQAVHKDIAAVVSGMQRIYSDGLVTEDEAVLLQRLETQMRAVLSLADGDVAAMLPRDVRDRLDHQLFTPLQTMADAAKQQQRALFSSVVARDQTDLQQRLNEPMRYFAGQGAPGIGQFGVGDRILVPRSDGSHTVGVVSMIEPTPPPSVVVSMLDDRAGFAQKTLGDEDVRRANPYKLGTSFQVNGCDVWITGGNAKGPTVTIERENGEVLSGGIELIALAQGRTSTERKHEAPVEERQVDLQVLSRQQLALDDTSRFRVGDFVCIPRSSGGFNRGVLKAMTDDRMIVEMNLPADNNGKQLWEKFLPKQPFRDANPMKLGDVVPYRGGHIKVTDLDQQGLRAVFTIGGKQQLMNHHQLAAVTRELSAGSVKTQSFASVPRGLPPQDARQVTALLVLKDDPVFGRLAAAMRTLLLDDAFRNQPVNDQARRVHDLLRDDQHLHQVQPNFGAVRKNIVRVQTHRLADASGDSHFQVATPPSPQAAITEVTLRVGASKSRFTVVIPANLSAEQHQRKLDDVVLALQQLPPEAVGKLQRIVVNPERNPHDVAFAKQFNTPDFKSAMTAHQDTGQITIYPGTSVVTAIQTFAHEVGHFVSVDAFGSMHSKTGTRWDDWTAAAKSDGIGVSMYGNKVGHEDFAESYSNYVTTRGTDRHEQYRLLMPARYALLDRIVGGNHGHG